MTLSSPTAPPTPSPAFACRRILSRSVGAVQKSASAIPAPKPSVRLHAAGLALRSTPAPSTARRSASNMQKRTAALPDAWITKGRKP